MFRYKNKCPFQIPQSRMLNYGTLTNWGPLLLMIKTNHLCVNWALPEDILRRKPLKTFTLINFFLLLNEQARSSSRYHWAGHHWIRNHWSSVQCGCSCPPRRGRRIAGWCCSRCQDSVPRCSDNSKFNNTSTVLTSKLTASRNTFFSSEWENSGSWLDNLL